MVVIVVAVIIVVASGGDDDKNGNGQGYTNYEDTCEGTEILECQSDGLKICSQSLNEKVNYMSTKCADGCINMLCVHAA